MKFNYFLPFAFSFVVLLLLQWYLNNPKMIYWVVGIIVLLTLLVSYFLNKGKQTEWYKFAILPIVSNVIVVGYSIILINSTFLQILIILLTVLNYIYWRYVFYYLYNPKKYIPFSLENLSFYVNFIIIFLLGSLAYGLRSFLNLSMLTLGIIILISLILIIYQWFWVSKFDFKKHRVYMVVSILVLMQLFFILSFLPLDYNLLGFIWATNYYLTTTLINDRLNNKLNKRKIRYIVGLTLIVWIVLLLTARWI